MTETTTTRAATTKVAKIPTIHAALAMVAESVGMVGKNAKMEAGPARYKYRMLDDLINAVHGPLCEHGVTFVPSNVQMLDTLERTTKTGGVQYHLRALVTYAIYGPAGDCVYATVLAEGTDSGDKAGNKLMSGAYKYALGQVLSIPFSMEDQDATLSEPVKVPEVKELHAILERAAAKTGNDLEGVTRKWRASNGNMTLDEFLALPSDRIFSFVRQAAAFAKVDA